jgi:hypothetical protein
MGPNTPNSKRISSGRNEGNTPALGAGYPAGGVSDQAIIESARRHIQDDPHLAVYMVRDLDIVNDAGLTDIAWAMIQEVCGQSDAQWLFDELDKRLGRRR